MRGAFSRSLALGALLLGALTLAGCPDCPRPRTGYPAPSGPPPGPSPQLDTGTFEGRQPGTEYPVAWAWRHPSHLDSELWVLYKPGLAGGFTNFGSGSGDSYLSLTHFPWESYGDNDPSPGTTGTAAFITFVVGRYASEYGMTVDPATELEVLAYKTSGTTTAPSTVGMFEPGLYKVWQTNHVPYVGPPVAWLWRPAAPGNREIWLCYEKMTTWGYHLPGADHPDVSGMPYDLAEFRFQKFPDDLTANGATITGTQAEYDAAMGMFKDWVMSDITNDVLDVSEIEDPNGPPPSKVLYDHRIHQGP